MKLKKKYTNHKGWYLYNIAVRKDFQKQGVCKKMIEPMLEYINSLGKNCYLETHNSVNVEIYNRFGFSLVETGIVPGTNLKHYAMLKD